MYWHTVTYSTVAAYALILIAAIGAACYFVFPQASGSVLHKVAAALAGPAKASTNPMARQARFVNLDGKVQVKKANSVQWANADYQLTLDKGDLIRTVRKAPRASHSCDGTTYTVKGDTFVTVEENAIDQIALPGSPCTSAPVRSTWPRGVGMSPRSKAEFPLKMRWPLCMKIAAPTSERS